MASPLLPGSPEWHGQIVEDIIDPDRVIVDPHHHLWQHPGGFDYLLPDLWADTGSGHRIAKTVFVECHSKYRTEGPEHLKPVGETEFVLRAAEESAEGRESQARISGIIAYADLTLGDGVEAVLDAHETAGGGLFRGNRHAGARAQGPGKLMNPGRAVENLYADGRFRQGMKVLGRRGLPYDTWHYHYQNGDFCELAKAVPGTTMVLDHFGTPLGVGRYEGRREEVFNQWKEDIAEIARCDNVVAKLGGMAMPDNGFGWHLRDKPPTSDEFAAAQKRYYRHTIECFGPERCMLESNFPVDKSSIAYPILWNGLKKIVSDFTEDEKDLMFSGTATRIYRL